MLDDTLIRAGTPRHASFVRSRRRPARPPFECIALLLQGGGALGSYQAGVYEALAEADLHPDWVAGISIGAINSALIAGNAPTERVGKLRAFWEEITANPLLDWALATDAFTPKGDLARSTFNQISAAWALLIGAAGFFALRQPAPGSTRAVPSRRPAFMKPSSSKRPSSGSSTSTGSMLARCGSAWARSTCAPATSSISTTPRTRSDPNT